MKILSKRHHEALSTSRIVELKACASSPSYFISAYVKTQHPTDGVIGLDVSTERPYVGHLIDYISAHEGVIIKKVRQAGISTTALAYALWVACFKPDQRVMIGTVSRDVAMELRGRFAFMLDHLPVWMTPTIQSFTHSAIVLDNGSEIRFSPVTESFARGITCSFIYLDEFAFVRPEIQEFAYTCLAPCLPTGAKFIIGSSPNIHHDTYYRLWTGAMTGIGHFKPFEVGFWQTPGASLTRLGELQSLLEEASFRREYLGEFVS